MYCSNCGHEVKASDSFCSNCGARIIRPAPAADPAAAPTEKPPVSQNGPASVQSPGHQGSAAPAQQQKKGGFWRMVLIFAIVFLLFRGIGYLFGSSLAGGSGSTGKPVVSSIPTFSVSFTPVNLGSATFEVEQNGARITQTFNYRDDIVYMISETCTTSLPGISASAKAQIQQSLEEAASKYEKYSFITYSYNLGENTLVEFITYSHVDQAENIAALYELGLTDNKDEMISLAETRSYLLANGWTEK